MLLHWIHLRSMLPPIHLQRVLLLLLIHLPSVLLPPMKLHLQRALLLLIHPQSVLLLLLLHLQVLLMPSLACRKQLHDTFKDPDLQSGTSSVAPTPLQATLMGRHGGCTWMASSKGWMCRDSCTTCWAGGYPGNSCSVGRLTGAQEGLAVNDGGSHCQAFTEHTPLHQPGVTVRVRAPAWG